MGLNLPQKLRSQTIIAVSFFKKTVFWQFLNERHKIQIDLGA